MKILDTVVLIGAIREGDKHNLGGYAGEDAAKQSITTHSVFSC